MLDARTDGTLMQRVQAGERPALGQLYGRYVSRAYRAALVVCHDRECAQDAVQDAFMSVWYSRRTYQPGRGTVEQWVMGIVRHRASYLARRRSKTATLSEGTARLDAQLSQDDVPSAVDARIDIERLARQMKGLPPAQREVIRLGCFEGLTHQQISLRLALPSGTVKGRMRLGLRKLRAGLGEE
jgi:RNA polymerase sigma-70 factor, ECF subfamily